MLFFFFFNDTATTEIYTLSLHDALPISDAAPARRGAPHRPGAADRRHPRDRRRAGVGGEPSRAGTARQPRPVRQGGRSEEHTSELQSRQYLVCRLLLEKKKHTKDTSTYQ